MEELLDILHHKRFNTFVPNIQSVIGSLSLPAHDQIVLFGASQGGKEVLKKFKKFNINVSYFTDNNEKLWGNSFEGIEVISPNQLTKLKDPIVIISSSFQTSIYKQLKLMNIRRIFHFPLVDIISDKHYSYQIINDNIKSIIKISKIFVDDQSKRVFAGVIKYRLTKDLNYIDEIRSGDIYFTDFITFKEKEYFVDVGAFIGDTIYLFDKKNPYYENANILAFEPDLNNYSILKNKFEFDNRIKLSNYCLYDRKTLLRFSNNNDSSTSQIVKDSFGGGDTIKAISLDEYISDDFTPTFIKMDVEGAEAKVIKGAVKTITHNRPILAVSVYHHPEDLWEIPKKIMELGVSYNYYLRHHSYNICDTVLYCIPKNNIL